MCMSTPKGIIIIITAFNRNFVFTAGRRGKSPFFIIINAYMCRGRAYYNNIYARPSSCVAENEWVWRQLLYYYMPSAAGVHYSW